MAIVLEKSKVEDVCTVVVDINEKTDATDIMRQI